MNMGIVTRVMLGMGVVWGVGNVAGVEVGRGTKKAQPVHCSNGVYSLFEGARDGRMGVVRARLRENAPVNQRNELGQTPLHLAAAHGDPKIVQVLLAAGSDVLARDKKGKLPADMTSNGEIRKLCEKALGVRRKELAAFASIQKGEIAGLREALEVGGNPNANSEDGKQTLLAVAVEGRNLAAVRQLLAAGAKVDVRLDGGKTPLHLAAGRNAPDIVQALLAAGADPLAQGWNRATPLHDAVWMSAFDAFCALLPVYHDLDNWPDGAGNSPVVMAVRMRRANMVGEMIKRGLNVNAPQFAREPLLVLAAKNNDEAMVRLLLTSGADPSARDEHGRCAADYARGAVLQLLHQ